jgi:hypothetical protein
MLGHQDLRHKIRKNTGKLCRYWSFAEHKPRSADLWGLP